MTWRAVTPITTSNATMGGRKCQEAGTTYEIWPWSQSFSAPHSEPRLCNAALAQGDPGSWSVASTMPTGTGDSGVAALDGKIYVVGGSSFYPHILPTSPDMGSGTWGSSVNYEYDPATDTHDRQTRSRYHRGGTAPSYFNRNTNI